MRKRKFGAVKNNYKMFAFGHKFSWWQEFLMLHNYFHVDPGPGAHNGPMTGHYSGLLASWSSSNPLTSVFTRDRWKLILTVAGSEQVQ